MLIAVFAANLNGGKSASGAHSIDTDIEGRDDDLKVFSV